MWKLLTFRFQHAFVLFWRKHPAIVALSIGGVLTGVLAITLIVSLLHMSYVESWMLGVASILFISVPAGSMLAFIVLRWVPMVSMEEQMALIASLPGGTVPTDRRISLLERNLIVNTQGEVNAARASRLAMELGTDNASAVTRPVRL